jgi:hypothetical protein
MNVNTARGAFVMDIECTYDYLKFGQWEMFVSFERHGGAAGKCVDWRLLGLSPVRSRRINGSITRSARPSRSTNTCAQVIGSLNSANLEAKLTRDGQIEQCGRWQTGPGWEAASSRVDVPKGQELLGGRGPSA